MLSDSMVHFVRALLGERTVVCVLVRTRCRLRP